MKAWKILSTSELFKNKFFCLRKDKCELPDGRIMPGYFVFEFLDWVQIVAITREKQMITLNQYRHAAKKVFIEIPGGSLDPDEQALSAAKRELLEETGYHSDNWIELAPHFPNPATQSNRLKTFIAQDCHKIQDQDLDPYEDLEVVLRPIKTVYEMLNNGEIDHSLMIASLALARPKLDQSF